MRLPLLLLFCAAPAAAEAPPPDFFAGRYEAVGRDEASPPALIDASLALAPEGEGLAVTGCGGAAGHLAFEPVFEAGNHLHGIIGRWQVWCQFDSNPDNYPVLTCTSEDGLRLTLWPVMDPATEGPQCPDRTPIGQ
jgi:hypothetical protein